MPTLQTPPTHAQNVIEQVRQKLPELEVAALWIAVPSNIRYLTGFTDPVDAKLLVTLETVMLYTDFRYDVQAHQECTVPFHIARGKAVLEHAKTLIDGRPVAFESESVTYDKFMELQSVWQLPMRPVKELVEHFRMVKTPAELEVIRRSARIADEALALVVPNLKAGRTEADVALELEFTMRNLGADDKAFGITVASGTRGAMPHGGASSKIIQGGELVTIDMGALCDGYHSDMTVCGRTRLERVAQDLQHCFRGAGEGARIHQSWRALRRCGRTGSRLDQERGVRRLLRAFARAWRGLEHP
jgi:Xaa-Pro aminopeptidase